MCEKVRVGTTCPPGSREPLCIFIFLTLCSCWHSSVNVASLLSATSVDLAVSEKFPKRS